VSMVDGRLWHRVIGALPTTELRCLPMVATGDRSCKGLACQCDPHCKSQVVVCQERQPSCPNWQHTAPMIPK
jgi:hypothetical protein